ncbi:ParB/RepB/Spo0J family partition protein (plasmid) [Photobacterium leiognathi subsp. mandapamensis]|uniref:ParB/RepB/Spo0J family partition protein n=1 Tax=Photobacterium leiognathi TaxID=553611 RepID=UPI003AF386A2
MAKRVFFTPKSKAEIQQASAQTQPDKSREEHKSQALDGILPRENVKERALQSLGRLLDSEKFELLHEHFPDFAGSKPIEWTLQSGEKRTFKEVDIPFEDLDSKTTVTFEINGREQSHLNLETLSDLDSMTNQQHYPAIGYVNENGLIEFADGSRRRMRVILANGEIKSLRALVTNEPISSGDARSLAKTLQTAREHNLWELGKAASLHKENGLKQVEIADIMGINQRKVSYALKAFSVDSSIIGLFPNVGDLSFTDYNNLLKAQEKANDNDELAEEVQAARGLIDAVAGDPEFDATQIILKHFSDYVKAKKPKSTVVKFKDIATFKSKNQTAKKKEDVSKRRITYEFTRMPPAFQKELDAFLAKKLKELD